MFYKRTPYLTKCTMWTCFELNSALVRQVLCSTPPFVPFQAHTSIDKKHELVKLYCHLHIFSPYCTKTTTLQCNNTYCPFVYIFLFRRIFEAINVHREMHWKRKQAGVFVPVPGGLLALFRSKNTSLKGEVAVDKELHFSKHTLEKNGGLSLFFSPHEKCTEWKKLHICTSFCILREHTLLSSLLLLVFILFPWILSENCLSDFCIR